MTSWIQKKLLILENYLFVSKKDKTKSIVWATMYVLFMALYIVFYVQKFDYNQPLTIFLAICFVLIPVFINTKLIRFSFLFLILLLNPLLSSLMFTIDNRLIRVLIFGIIILLLLFSDFKKLLHLFQIIVIVNVSFCLILAYKFYNTNWVFTPPKSNPPISTLVNKADANKDIYIIILDGFSSKEVLKKYLNIESKLLNYLTSKGFEEKPSLSKYFFTDKSLPNIFSGVDFDENTRFTLNHINEMNTLIPGTYLNHFIAVNNYNKTINSLLLKPEVETIRDFGRGGDFKIYSYSLVDRVLKILGITYSIDGEEIDKITKTNNDLIKKSFSAKKKHFGIYHYLTFHMVVYDLSFEKEFKANLEQADEVGIKAVNLILKNKPKAKIIVLSDHGERYASMDQKDFTKGILYIKN